MDISLPASPWAAARKQTGTPSQLPQTISHRGYSAAFPENTMAAFRGAVEAGTHAIETDLHLSKDGVIVLSHDATLKRCFGDARRVVDYDWEVLKAVRTLKEPTQPMPRLIDLLEYLGQPEQRDIWLLLDIKVLRTVLFLLHVIDRVKTDNDQAHLLTGLAELLASVPTTRPWKNRIMLGVWDAEWVSGCLRYLPGFPIALIAFSPPYATAMLPVTQLSFNLYNYSFATCRGSKFIKRAKAEDRLIFSWTDNTDDWMVKSLENEADGVITDDPKRFREVCEQWSSSDDSKMQDGAGGRRLSVKQTILWLIINFLVILGEVITGLVKGSPRTQVKRALGI
ncbi:Phosphatidylglycerol phospholipase C [Apiospora rasikravindrae]|uniref:Phosphatidylglycerol phospholipase C n=1 Tax=Apiospora rasikravindrae TaxID=990691 RepID=A0ABR1RRT5_9PEZI